MTRHWRRRPVVTVVTLVSLLPTPGALLAAPGPRPRRPSAAPAATAAAAGAGRRRLAARLRDAERRA